jgi:hypothetical protein
MKSSSSEIDSLTGSLGIKPCSAMRAWAKIFCTSYCKKSQYMFHVHSVRADDTNVKPEKTTIRAH